MIRIFLLAVFLSFRVNVAFIVSPEATGSRFIVALSWLLHGNNSGSYLYRLRYQIQLLTNAPFF